VLNSINSVGGKHGLGRPEIKSGGTTGGSRPALTEPCVSGGASPDTLLFRKGRTAQRPRESSTGGDFKDGYREIATGKNVDRGRRG